MAAEREHARVPSPAGAPAAEEFGPYQLERLLGRGGMGEVFRAFDTEHDRLVALKRLNAHLADDREFQERFRREARLAARLRNPHVIPIHRFGEIDGHLYIDMRYVEGFDAGDLIDTVGAVDPARAVSLVEQAASALATAHAAGLVHRDVKPSNLLIDRESADLTDGFVYLADFGICRSTTSTRSHTLTRSGAVLGSLDYMAPEQFDGVTDPRVDIYSLTCVLFELLTGHKPYRGNNLPALMHAHLHIPPPLPTDLRPELPDEFDEVVRRGMAKSMDERYGSPVELARAARSALAGLRTGSAGPAGSAAADEDARSDEVALVVRYREANQRQLAKSRHALREEPEPDESRVTAVPDQDRGPAEASVEERVEEPTQERAASWNGEPVEEPAEEPVADDGSEPPTAPISSPTPAATPPPTARSKPSPTARPTPPPTARPPARPTPSPRTRPETGAEAPTVPRNGVEDRSVARSGDRGPADETVDLDAPRSSASLPRETDDGAEGILAAETQVNTRSPYSGDLEEPRSSSRTRIIAAVVSTLAIALVCFLVVALPRSETDGAAPSGPVDAVPTTAPPVETTAPAAPLVASATPTIEKQVELGGNPQGAALAPDGNTVYVAVTTSGEVVAVDTASGEVRQRFGVPGVPRYVAVSRDGQRVFVAMSAEDGSGSGVVGIDVLSGAVVGPNAVVERPYALAVAPDGRLWVPSHGSSNIAVLDRSSLGLVATVDVPDNPHAISFSPTGDIAYSANHESGTVSLIDAKSAQLITSVLVEARPHGVAVSPDGREVATANYQDGSVSVIPADGEPPADGSPLVRIFKAGPDPQNLTWSVDGKYLYVVNVEAGTVTSVDAATGQLGAPVPVGASTRFILGAPDGRLFATSYDDQTVTVLRAAE